MSPMAYLPQATEFARRGWAAVVLMRRGYGDSGGDWAETLGSCNNPDYVKAATSSVSDLRAVIAHLGTRPDIDSSKIISVGQSAGGFATVALTADPPPGLVAAINFAGGRGSQSDDEVCREERLIEAMRAFGRRSRLPMPWIYAENDKFFGPTLARKMRDAFADAGGQVQFVALPPFGRDGHSLFSSGIRQWTPTVDKFLQERRLVLQDGLLPPPTSAKTPANFIIGDVRRSTNSAPQGRTRRLPFLPAERGRGARGGGPQMQRMPRSKPTASAATIAASSPWTTLLLSDQILLD